MGKAKKVLFTSHTANFHKFNRPFMRMLKEQGYTVHYASAGEEKVYDTDKHFDVPFERSPFKPGNIKAYFKLKKIIDREDYDLIHTHTPTGSVITRLAARRARKKGTRVIYTAHGFHFFKGAPLLNWVVYYPIEKFMARYTDAIVTINSEDSERASRNFDTKVYNLPGIGVNVEAFDINMSSADKLKLRKSIGFKSKDFVLIYVAELLKRKDQMWLIKTLKDDFVKNKDLHLLLVGADSMSGELQKNVKDLKIESKVHFTGYRRDVPQLMKMSDLAVSTSLQEGLGLNLIEAMSAGLPLVVTDNRGHRDAVNGLSCATIVALGDDVTFREAVVSHYENRHKHNGISARDKDIFMKFSVEKVLPLMKQIYDAINEVSKR